MKKFSPKTVLVCLLCCASSVCSAYNFKIGDLFYSFNDNTMTAKVAPPNIDDTPLDKYLSGVVEVPSSVIFGGETYSVTGIDDKALASCTRVTSFVLPSTLTYIGSKAFMGCSSLTTVDIPASVTYLGDGVFMNCTSLPGLTWPPKSIKIPDSAFEGCINLSGFTIPSTVRSIGSYAFKGCKALTEIVIPTSIRDYGDAILYDSGVTHPVYNKTAFFYCPPSMEGTYTVPEGIISLTPQSFLNCTRLKKIVLPESTTMSFGPVFTGCTGLEYPVLNSTTFFFMPPHLGVRTYTVPDGIIRIVESAFDGCTSLEEVTLPGSLTLIDDEGFKGCSRLKGIRIPAAVTELGNHCFSGCTAMQSAQLPDNLEDLGTYCFEGCSSLKEIVVPDKVKELSFDTFSGCSSLEKATIGEGVTEVGADCFKGCKALKEIVALPFYPAKCQSSAFYEGTPFSDVDTKTCILRVKPESLDYYKEAPVWKLFYHIEALDSSVESISADGASSPSRKGCYDLRGVRVCESSDTEVLEALPSGIYIIDGRKVLK